MRSFCPIFLCFVLVFLVQALAKVVPVGQDVHLRGYGGDDSYGSYESYESSSESSSSESSSCELPEPRKECPTAGASYAPLFVAHGTLNWLGEYTQVEPPVICDCDTGAKLFFTDKPNDGIPSSMQDAQDKDIMSYTLNNDRYCPHMCLRDTNGKFWVPKSNDPPSTVVFITTVCASGSCVNYAINQGNYLKDESSTTELSNPTVMNQAFPNSVYLKVDAISCRGCDLIRKKVTEKCYAIEGVV